MEKRCMSLNLEIVFRKSNVEISTTKKTMKPFGRTAYANDPNTGEKYKKLGLSRALMMKYTAINKKKV
jgi:hypothetical protein